MNNETKQIDIPETIKKLTNFMKNDNKFVKASTLFVNVIYARYTHYHHYYHIIIINNHHQY